MLLCNSTTMRGDIGLDKPTVRRFGVKTSKSDRVVQRQRVKTLPEVRFLQEIWLIEVPANSPLENHLQEVRYSPVTIEVMFVETALQTLRTRTDRSASSQSSRLCVCLQSLRPSSKTSRIVLTLMSFLSFTLKECRRTFLSLTTKAQR